MNNNGNRNDETLNMLNWVLLKVNALRTTHTPVKECVLSPKLLVIITVLVWDACSYQFINKLEYTILPFLEIVFLFIFSNLYVNSGE